MKKRMLRRYYFVRIFNDIGPCSLIPVFQQIHNICITFMQCWANDAGLTLYKWYTNVLYLLGSNSYNSKPMTDYTVTMFNIISCVCVCFQIIVLPNSIYVSIGKLDNSGLKTS